MTRILAPLSVLVLAITMSISAFAGTTKSETLTLNHDVQLNGTTIPAGEYKVQCETNGNTAQVKFMKGKKEIASASGQTKNLDRKMPVGRLVLNSGNGAPTLQEYDPGGTNTGVVFGSTMANTGQ